jgi:hypothetical protein
VPAATLRPAIHEEMSATKASGNSVAPLRLEDAVQQVLAVQVPRGRRSPDLINDDAKLREDSFVVPGEALGDIPGLRQAAIGSRADSHTPGPANRPSDQARDPRALAGAPREGVEAPCVWEAAFRLAVSGIVVRRVPPGPH